MGKGWQPPKGLSCEICTKTVYHMEKIEADNKVYHKTCFKCTQCKKSLSAGNYAGMNGQVYCKTHFKQLFKTKGNYNFGKGAASAPNSFSVNVKPTTSFCTPIKTGSATPGFTSKSANKATKSVEPAAASASKADAKPVEVTKVLQRAPSVAERMKKLAANASNEAIATPVKANSKAELVSTTSTPKMAAPTSTTTTPVVAGVTTGPRASFSKGPMGFNAVSATNKGHFAPTPTPTHVVKCDVTPVKTVIKPTGGVAAIAARFASLSAASTPANSPAALKPASAEQRRRSSAKVEAALNKFKAASNEKLLNSSSKPASSSSLTAKSATVKSTAAATSANKRRASNNKSVRDAVALFEQFNTTAESSPVTLRPKYVFNGTLAGEQEPATSDVKTKLEFEVKPVAVPADTITPTEETSEDKTETEQQQEAVLEREASTVSSHSFTTGGSLAYDLTEEDAVCADFEACDGVLDEDEEEAEANEQPSDLAEVERRLSRRLSSLLNVSDAFEVDMANLSIADENADSLPASPAKVSSRKSSFSVDVGVPQPLGRRLSSMMNISEFMDTDLSEVNFLQVA